MVTLWDAKNHVRASFDDDDAAIQRMINAAMDHLRSIDVDVDVDPLPPALHHAILLLVGHFYDNRNAVTEAEARVLPLGVARLIAPYREYHL